MENNQDGMDSSKVAYKDAKTCNCAMCRHGGGHAVLRWVLGIVLLLVVFCLGVMVGSFRHSHGYSRGGYMGHYPNPIMRVHPVSGSSGMMRTGTSGMAPQSATTTPVK